MDDLKNYDKELVYIIIFNIVVLLFINNRNMLVDYSSILSIILTVPALFFPIYFINNAICSDFKFKILYPCNEKHRYAYGIFTRMIEGDLKYDGELIDLDLIINTYSMPKTKPKEDDLWYRIYNKHRYDNKIYQQHRQFLFFRDYTTIILIITLIFSIFVFLMGFYSFIPMIIVLGVGEFIISWGIAICRNKILALSVLQEETNSLKKTNIYFKSNSLYSNFICDALKNT